MVAERLDELAVALRGVDMEEGVVPGKHCCDLVDRLDHAGLVVHRHHGHQERVGAQGGRDRVGGRPNRPRSVRSSSTSKPRDAEHLQRLENRLVLDLRRDDVALPDASPCAASPRTARLSLSVAPLVKITSSGLAATTAATSSRARVDPLLGDLAVAVGAAPGVAELVAT